MRKTYLSIAATLAMAVAASASAQGYVGGGLGWSRVGIDCSGLDGGGVVVQCDKTSTGGKLYGGFRVAEQLAVELVYFDWGKATGEGTMPASTVVPSSALKRPLAVGDTVLSGRLQATGFGIGGAYIVPFGRDWSALARLGVAWNSGKLDASASDGTTSTSRSVSKRSAQPYAGFGVGYQVTPKVGITGEVDFSRVKYGAVGAFETDSVQLVTLGLRFMF